MSPKRAPRRTRLLLLLAPEATPQTSSHAKPSSTCCQSTHYVAYIHFPSLHPPAMKQFRGRCHSVAIAIITMSHSRILAAAITQEQRFWKKKSTALATSKVS